MNPKRFVIAAGLLLAATTTFAVDFEWFTGAGMGWPAAPDFVFLDGVRIEREEIVYDGTMIIVDLGESYGVRGGFSVAAGALIVSVSLSNGAFFPGVLITEWDEDLPEPLLPLTWSTRYRERPNFLSGCIDALVGVKIPVGGKVSLRASVGGAVVVDAWYLVKERTVSENINEGLIRTAPRTMRLAYGGAAELGILVKGRATRSLEVSYRQFFFAPVDFTHPNGTFTTWFPAFQVYVGLRSSSSERLPQMSRGADRECFGTYDGGRYFYLSDHLGSTVGITDDIELLLWQGDAVLFGERTGEAGLLDEKLKVTGKDVDPATGLYYFNARWYDAQTGRFTSEDPVRDGWNSYQYARSNPLKWVDPDGREAQDMQVFGFGATKSL